jgi:hypothetical protein
MKVALCLPSHGGAYRGHEKCLARLRHAEPTWQSLELAGAPCIDIARAVLAEQALELEERPDVLLWLDADMTFSPNTCRTIASEAWFREAIVGCLYAGKSLGSDPQCIFKGEAKPIQCFEFGSVIEVHSIGFGVVAFPTKMLETIAEKQELVPQRVGKKTYRPWFTNDPRWDSAHSDDYAFCRRARESGFRVFADTRQRVGHIGLHEFHLEDMAGRPLLPSLTLAQEERPKE